MSIGMPRGGIHLFEIDPFVDFKQMNEHPDAQSVCLQRGMVERMGREEEWDGRRRVTEGGVALVDFSIRNCEEIF